jgi:hypothetical protein
MKDAIKACDYLWSELVKISGGYKCAMCEQRATDPHHIITRTRQQFRHHPMNGVLLCREHHNWAHEHPQEFMTWLSKKRKDQYAWSEQATKQPEPMMFDYENIAQDLEKRVVLLQKETMPWVKSRK